MNNFPLIILSAGKSTRMKSPKGLVKFKNKSLLEFQVENFLKIGGKEIYIVLGYNLEEYKTNFPWSKHSDQVKYLVNPNPSYGQFSSLQVGLTAIKNYPAAWILPIDCPFPEDSTWITLEKNFNSEKYAIIPKLNKRRGHPILLTNKFINQLIKLCPSQPNSRLDYQLENIPEKKISFIKTNDDKILFNINSLPELKMIEEFYQNT